MCCDNEAGKGNHNQLGSLEMPYVWRRLEWLVADFIADVEASSESDHRNHELGPNQE